MAHDPIHPRSLDRPVLFKRIVMPKGEVMKHFRSMLFAVAVLALGTAAHAQQSLIQSTVPFSFMVGDKLYPAGDYVIEKTAVASNVLLVYNRDRQEPILIVPSRCLTGGINETPKLVFDHLGGAYSLRQIWTAHNISGFELRHSNTEARLALNAAPTEEVTIAAYTTQK